ncbi:hypothetical protein [Sphingomonas sp. IW22]|uniref:hypothetical protein n=1 Tax=Sphingomonas sp. IW22 TaxID=3242489 RepID=UPI0035202287
MATKRLKGFGWFVCGVLVAPPCYLVSSWVAAERARVESLERAILTAKSDIRDLETEFQTRANLAQLEKWNGEVLALAAPRPDQYVAGEEALAQLHFAPAGEGAVSPVSYIVPSGIADNRLQTASVAAEAAPVPAPAAAPAKVEQPRRAAPVALAAVSTPSPSRAMPAPKPVRKGQAVAMLDDVLLSDRTLGDLARGARAETVRKR